MRRHSLQRFGIFGGFGDRGDRLGGVSELTSLVCVCVLLAEEHAGGGTMQIPGFGRWSPGGGVFRLCACNVSMPHAQVRGMQFARDCGRPAVLRVFLWERGGSGLRTRFRVGVAIHRCGVCLCVFVVTSRESTHVQVCAGQCVTMPHTGLHTIPTTQGSPVLLVTARSMLRCVCCGVYATPPPGHSTRRAHAAVAPLLDGKEHRLREAAGDQPETTALHEESSRSTNSTIQKQAYAY